MARRGLTAINDLAEAVTAKLILNVSFVIT